MSETKSTSYKLPEEITETENGAMSYMNYCITIYLCSARGHHLICASCSKHYAPIFATLLLLRPQNFTAGKRQHKNRILVKIRISLPMSNTDVLIRIRLPGEGKYRP